MKVDTLKLSRFMASILAGSLISAVILLKIPLAIVYGIAVYGLVLYSTGYYRYGTDKQRDIDKEKEINDVLLNVVDSNLICVYQENCSEVETHFNCTCKSAYLICGNIDDRYIERRSYAEIRDSKRNTVFLCDYLKVYDDYFKDMVTGVAGVATVGKYNSTLCDIYLEDAGLKSIKHGNYTLYINNSTCNIEDYLKSLCAMADITDSIVVACDDGIEVYMSRYPKSAYAIGVMYEDTKAFVDIVKSLNQNNKEKV